MFWRPLEPDAVNTVEGRNSHGQGLHRGSPAGVPDDRSVLLMERSLFFAQLTPKALHKIAQGKREARQSRIVEWFLTFRARGSGGQIGTATR
jgi:hypothetical protein